MKKLAIIDAKLVLPHQANHERTNVLVYKNKLIGIGYIPDDDESQSIQANGYYLINALTGIDLNITEIHKKEALKSGITNWIPINTDKETGKLCSPASDPNISELIATAENTQTPCLIAITSTEELALIKPNYTHTKFSINLSLLLAEPKQVLPHITANSIIHIHFSPPYSETLILSIVNALKTTLSFGDTCNLLGANAHSFLMIKIPSISLLNTPNFTLFSPDKTPSILGVVLEGKWVVL